MAQALRSYSEHVIGLDISSSMLRHARLRNRHGDSVEYRLSEGTDLAQFPDHSFDLVHSCYVLQHMHPVYAQRFVREFLRVLEPGGTLLLQVASDHLWEEAPQGTQSPWDAEAVDWWRVQAQYSTPEPFRAQPRFSLNRRFRKLLGRHDPRPIENPILMAPLQLGTVLASLRNDSAATLPAGPSRDRLHQWKLGARVFDASFRDRGHEQWTMLPFDLAPGQEVHLPVRVCAPSQPGKYRVVLGLHDDREGWLGDPKLQPSWPLEVRRSRAPARAITQPQIEMYGMPDRIVREIVAQGRGVVLGVSEDKSAGPAFTARRYWIRKLATRWPELGVP